MRLLNLNNRLVLALLAVLSTTVLIPVKANEAGMTLDDSIRQQIFLELKDNVEYLYRNSRQNVNRIEPTITVQVVNRSIEGGFSPPLRIQENNPVRRVNHELLN